MSEKPNLTHLSLFSGIGGLDLAAEWAGFRMVRNAVVPQQFYPFFQAIAEIEKGLENEKQREKRGP